MFFRSLWFLILLVPCSSHCIAQSNRAPFPRTWEEVKLPDSVRFKALESYYVQSFESDIDAVLAVNDYHLELADAKASSYEKFIARVWRSRTYYNGGLYDEALEWVQSAARFSAQLDDPDIVFELPMLGGTILRDQGKYRESIRIYTLGLEEARKRKSTSKQFVFLNNLALIHIDLRFFEPAMEYLVACSALLEEIGSPRRNAFYFLNLGKVNFELGDYEDAVSNLTQALGLFESLRDLLNQSGCHYFLAKTHSQLGDDEQARRYAEECLAIDKELGHPRNIFEDEILLASMILPGDVDEAVNRGERLLAEMTEATPLYLKVDLYELLYKGYKQQGKIAQSLEMHEIFTVFNDSNDIRKKQIAVIRESLQVEQEIKLREKDAESQREYSKVRSQLWWTLGIGGVFIFITFMAFWSIAKKSRKKREELEHELLSLKADSIIIRDPGTDKSGLNRKNIEESLGRKLNETDWKVLDILYENPFVSNKKIAELVCMSVSGISSSLRRMYAYFDIEETRNKKMALLLDATKRSGNPS